MASVIESSIIQSITIVPGSTISLEDMSSFCFPEVIELEKNPHNSFCLMFLPNLHISLHNLFLEFELGVYKPDCVSLHSSNRRQTCGQGSECVELAEVGPGFTTIGPCELRVRIPVSIKGHGPRLARESELLLVLVGVS